MNSIAVFIVLHYLANGAVQPVFRDDNDALLVFMDEASAHLEIEDCIDSIAEAIRTGDMDEDAREDTTDYEILPVACFAGDRWVEADQRIFAYWDGSFYTMRRGDDDWSILF